MRLVSLIALIPFLVHAYPRVPVPELTPGELCSVADRDFSGRRYPEQIAVCERNVERDLKTEIYRAYNIPLNCRYHYTVDHLIPLSIGGNNSRQNLWPEHKLLKAARQDLEQEVFDAVREGKRTQAEGIIRIREAKLNPPIEIFKNADCDN